MEQNFKFDFVDITIEGDSVYFGDIAGLEIFLVFSLFFVSSHI